MSFQLTTDQVRAKQKTVTRRLGWRFLKAGDLVQAVKQCQGLKKGQKVEKLHVLRIKSVTREPLAAILWRRGEVAKEGFPRMRAGKFIEMFMQHHRGSEATTRVARIEFEYVSEVKP